MSRNSSGNYTLPTGNPVLTGTTISTVWANATLGDLAAEMTDSLNRSGKGAMLAPLQLDEGTVATPALTFDTDPDVGLYHVSANTVGMSAGSTQIQRWTTTGTTITGTASVSGAATIAGGAVVTNSTTNGNGASVTANGTGIGVDGTGGATSGYGVRGTGGAPNGQGVVGMGTGTGYGIEGVGGPDGGGGIFTPGTAATAAVRSNAVVAYTGDILFSTTTNPNSDVAMTNRLTPANIVKAWATLTTTGGGSTVVTVTDGVNIASAACDTDSIGVTLASAFANTTYAVFASCKNLSMVLKCTPATPTGIDISGSDLSPGVDLSVNPIAAYNFRDAASVVIHVMVIGRQ